MTIVCVVYDHCVVFFLQHDGIFLPHRVAGGMSGTNPKPRDLHNAVVVMDGDEMRLRRADEATEAGKETEHHMFIFCVNIGVRWPALAQHLH